MHNFVQCCDVNSPGISEKSSFGKIEEEKSEKGQKKLVLMFVKVKLGISKYTLSVIPESSVVCSLARITSVKTELKVSQLITSLPGRLVV